MKSIKRQKDVTLEDETPAPDPGWKMSNMLPGEELGAITNSSRKNEAAGPKGT